MSTHAYIADPVINQNLHVPLFFPALVITGVLIIAVLVIWFLVRSRSIPNSGIHH